MGCAVVSVARAAEPGPYAKAEIGPTFTDDVELREFVGLGGGGTIEFDPGMRFAFGGGYQFADWIAIGGETGFSFNYIENISGGNFRGEGDSSIGQVPLLANVIFRIPTKIGLVPFAGAGAGLSFPYFYADDIVFDPTPNIGGDETIVDGSESDTVFAWQAFAGLKYQIDSRMSVGISYKYLRAESPDWETEDVFTGFESEIAIGDLETHAITFIFSYRF